MFKEQLRELFPKKTIFLKSTNSKNFEIKIDETINKDTPYYELSIGQDFIELRGEKRSFLWFTDSISVNSIE